MTRKLLIDGDVVAYQCASAVEKEVNWGDGYYTWHTEVAEVQKAIREKVDAIMADLDGDEYALCLTDSEGNFRRLILPTYKGNRANVKKPLALRDIKEWMIEELGAYFRPTLEGDDCMGILATMPPKAGEDRIIVSIDKDMKTIPGLFSRDSKNVVQVSETEADYWHLFQTLTGDATDGYSGCPGIGPKKAAAILDDEDGPDSLWDRVVATYEKAGFTAEDALVQARVARILRASDYDFKRKEPILWTP
jgi:DNA polymerase-1